MESSPPESSLTTRVAAVKGTLSTPRREVRRYVSCQTRGVQCDMAVALMQASRGETVQF
jgi:hypothetical protein